MKQYHTPLFFLFALFTGPLAAQGVELHRSCDCPTVRLDDAYCASSVVFEGTALLNDTIYADSDIKPVARDVIESIRTNFLVSKVIKGKLDKNAMVQSATRIDACGFHFRPGARYLVFASTDNGALRTDRCDATRPMDVITPAFRDSLAYVQAGNRWEGGTPVPVPCP